MYLHVPSAIQMPLPQIPSIVGFIHLSVCTSPRVLDYLWVICRESPKSESPSHVCLLKARFVMTDKRSKKQQWRDHTDIFHIAKPVKSNLGWKNSLPFSLPRLSAFERRVARLDLTETGNKLFQSKFEFTSLHIAEEIAACDKTLL